ncbi:MAG: hypothetical protein U5R48_01525 [Gammaproteobacteria bacterium]|nr:hypothetical protein [Gammaproteobacteria bacterium]
MPGTWLQAEERVAVAAEARVAETCSACARARQALSPEADSGSHDRSDASLPEAWHGLIHRVIADPGRVSRSWFDRIRTAGVEDTTYVEILGTLVTAKLIDSFCRGLGLPLHPLPGAPGGVTLAPATCFCRSGRCLGAVDPGGCQHRCRGRTSGRGGGQAT